MEPKHHPLYILQVLDKEIGIHNLNSLQIFDGRFTTNSCRLSLFPKRKRDDQFSFRRYKVAVRDVVGTVVPVAFGQNISYDSEFIMDIINDYLIDKDLIKDLVLYPIEIHFGLSQINNEKITSRCYVDELKLDDRVIRKTYNIYDFIKLSFYQV